MKSNKIYTAILMILLLALIVTTMMDINVPYLPVLVVAAFVVAAIMHSRKTFITELILDGEMAELVLAGGQRKKIRQRDIVQIKVSGTGAVMILKNKEDYNIRKKTVIRKDGRIQQGIGENDFPFAEFKKALR